MRLPGYCEGCHRIRQVRPGQKAGVLVGLCAECEAAREPDPERHP